MNFLNNSGKIKIDEKKKSGKNLNKLNRNGELLMPDKNDGLPIIFDPTPNINQRLLPFHLSTHQGDDESENRE